VGEAIAELEALIAQLETESSALDTLQNQIKVKMNSLYGLLGSLFGIGLKAVAETITMIGRRTDKNVKYQLETRYKEFGLVANYSDTDSLMLTTKSFPNTYPLRAFKDKKDKGKAEREQWFRFAKGDILPNLQGLLPPMRMEPEKVGRTILYGPKMYAMDSFTEKDVNKLLIKGLAPTRRDMPKVVSEAFKKMFPMIFQHSDPETLLKPLHEVLNLFKERKLTALDLNRSISIKKKYKQGESNLSHVLKAWMKNAEYDVQVGSRVAFTIIEAPGTKLDMPHRYLARPVDYVMKKEGIRVNYIYYLTDIILKPLLRLYGLIIPPIKLSALIFETVRAVLPDQRFNQGYQIMSVHFQRLEFEMFHNQLLGGTPLPVDCISIVLAYIKPSDVKLSCLPSVVPMFPVGHAVTKLK
jgi:DNA polymerase elongation subunit (family B)